MDKVSEKLSDFLKFVRDCKTELKLYSEYVDTEDKKTQDILHKIELNTLKRDEKTKIVTKLAEVRRTRREFKDRIEAIDDICKYFEDPAHLSMIRDLEQILGKVRKIEERQGNKIYVPRVLTENEDYYD